MLNVYFKGGVGMRSGTYELKGHAWDEVRDWVLL